MGSRSRAASEGRHRAKLQLKQGGMETKPSRGTQAHGTCLTPSYPRPSCHPQRGWQSRVSMAQCRGKDWLPPYSCGKGQAAQVLPPDKVRKQRKGDVSQKGRAPTAQQHFGLHHCYAQVGSVPASWDMGATRSLWPTLGGCPALTPSWHPPVLASDLQWSSWQTDPTLQEFFSTQGVSSTKHPQHSTATSHPAE